MPDTWQDRYRVTSVTGRIWTREMVHHEAMRWLRALSDKSAELRSCAVSEALDDVDVMRPMTGMVPAHVAREVGYAAWRRLR